MEGRLYGALTTLTCLMIIEYNLFYSFVGELVGKKPTSRCARNLRRPGDDARITNYASTILGTTKMHLAAVIGTRGVGNFHYAGFSYGGVTVAESFSSSTKIEWGPSSVGYE